MVCMKGRPFELLIKVCAERREIFLGRSRPARKKEERSLKFCCSKSGTKESKTGY